MQVQTTYEVTVAVRDGTPEIRFRPWSVNPDTNRREIFGIPLDDEKQAGQLIREFASTAVAHQQQAVAELAAALQQGKRGNTTTG
ncbi:MAG: hypothetical protein AAF916_09855 [Planctomycetota bacterium]